MMFLVSVGKEGECVHLDQTHIPHWLETCKSICSLWVECADGRGRMRLDLLRYHTRHEKAMDYICFCLWGGMIDFFCSCSMVLNHQPIQTNWY